MKVFSHPQFGTVRAVEIQGEPWLVGKDDAESLGYTAINDNPKTHTPQVMKVIEEYKNAVDKSVVNYYRNALSGTVKPFQVVSLVDEETTNKLKQITGLKKIGSRFVIKNLRLSISTTDME